MALSAHARYYNAKHNYGNHGNCSYTILLHVWFLKSSSKSTHWPQPATPVANEIILVVVLQKSSKCWPGTSQQVSSAFGLHYLHHPTRSQQSGQSVTLCDISSDMFWGYVAARLSIWSWNCGRWHGYKQKRTYVQCLTLQRTKYAHQIQWPHSTHATWPNHQVIAYQCPRLACTCMYACKVGLTEMCHNQSVLWLSVDDAAILYHSHTHHAYLATQPSTSLIDSGYELCKSE